MIPILFSSTETVFDNNGLGRLYDCISCVVTEERNGIYECDFEYPVTGSHFDDILLGRIIGVEHDESNDIQPFDIVSYSRPIDGVVTFHAVHVSYRLSKMVVIDSSINSLADAFEAFEDALPSMPFTFDSDKTSSGYVSCFNGTPMSVKSCLGGVEGSILDAYGGEYEFDKFIVHLWERRGIDRTMSIRYGLNLTQYDEETDYSDSYNACIGYWKGQENNADVTVVTDLVTASLTSYNNRDEAMPIDLTDKFESKPSKADLTTAAESYLVANQTNLPTQNINVDFVNLKDTLEYADYAQLWQCHLCDTVNVVFPRYGMNGRFKVVKTVYDVLQERFTSMELGSLALTLSEALGLGG